MSWLEVRGHVSLCSPGADRQRLGLDGGHGWKGLVGRQQQGYKLLAEVAAVGRRPELEDWGYGRESRTLETRLV